MLKTNRVFVLVCARASPRVFVHGALHKNNKCICVTSSSFYCLFPIYLIHCPLKKYAQSYH